MLLRAVIFDLGGTLIYHRKETSALSGLGYQALTDYLVGKGSRVKYEDVAEVSSRVYEAYGTFSEASCIELDPHILYSAILQQLGIENYGEALIAGAINSFYDPLVADHGIFEDVQETLSGLREKGLKLGLITNNHSTDFHLRLLHKFDLERFFDSITVSSRVGVRKPDKRIFKDCLSKLCVSADESIMVGDHPIHDVEGARRMGMRCVWVKRKDDEDARIEPDWTVQSIKQAGEVIVHLL